MRSQTTNGAAQRRKARKRAARLLGAACLSCPSPPRHRAGSAGAPSCELGAALTGGAALSGHARRCRPLPASPPGGCALVASDRRRRRRPALWPARRVRRRRDPPQRAVAHRDAANHRSVFRRCSDLHGIITPNGLFFERHHAGRADVDPAQHRLMIHGLVERPLVLTMKDIVRFPSVSRIHFIECPANGGMEWRAAQLNSLQFTHGMICCAEWTGVKLSTLLEEVGVKKEAKWVMVEGADGAHMNRSLPLDKCLDDCLVVYAQNGEALRPEQGYPLRLVVPGWEGNVNIKWLRRIKLGDEPWFSREETSKYTDLMPDGTSRGFTWLNDAKSVITFPCPEKPLRSPGPLRDPRTGLERQRQGQAGRRFDRRRRQLAGRATARAGAVEGADQVHDAVALGRPAGAAGIARRSTRPAMCSRPSRNCERCAARIRSITTIRSRPGRSSRTGACSMFSSARSSPARSARA